MIRSEGFGVVADNLLRDRKLLPSVEVYEDGIKKLKEKIRSELQVRRDLKAKISEAKKREAFEIQTLERLDEYEKIVTKQFESSYKMEDSESIKEISFVEKYEIMFQEQKKIWKQYEDKYEELPLAQKRLLSQVELMKCTISRKLINQKINEITKNALMKSRIEKRRRQLEIIGFAKSLLDLKKREKHCNALANEIKSLEFQEKELLSEVKDVERQSMERDRSVKSYKTSMQTQQPPKLDFSNVIFRQDVNSLHYDKSGVYYTFDQFWVTRE
ncbi:hypothetical protein QAD02_016373 [Eretmocerus hayati]|uniref:Uncharacterized protein n=1 Tax=Eretmocerus hayati TaxID=131215 RepID=A0ACC2PAW9_9HYME|nr:hypothetical protein QAD02_016373 [Eretmocerus hayati]